MLRAFTCLSPLFVALALTGCGGKVERTDSTVKGNFELNSFPSKVVALEAINEKGGVTRAEVDASGAFSIGLARGHKYQVRVILANGSEPMVFPRADGSLDLDFKVSTGAAVLALGKVNHFASAPPTGFVVSGNSSGEGEVGECVDGHLMGTGEACVDDDAEVSCEMGDEGEQEGEHEDGPGDGDGDGECENGVDQATGAACADDPEADPSQPMAVAELRVPDDLGDCADDDGENEEEDD